MIDMLRLFETFNTQTDSNWLRISGSTPWRSVVAIGAHDKLAAFPPCFSAIHDRFD
jgi:hypothetical protein